MTSSRRPSLPSQTRPAIGRPPGLELSVERLRARRSALGLSQEALATRAGLSTRTLQNAERGRRVSSEVARALAATLGVDLAELVVGEVLPIASLHERLVEAGFAPPEPPELVGFEETRRALSGLFHETGTVCIVGAPGTGKSALAADLVAGLGADGGFVCWLDAARVARVDTTEVLSALGRCLGFGERLPNPNLVPPAAFARAFRRHFWAQAVTLVLDDLGEPGTFALLCEGEGPRRVIVTTARRGVATELGLPSFEPSPLDTTSALALLSERGSGPFGPDSEGELEAAEALIALVGRNPRALRWLGRRLARERFSRVADLVERLRSRLSLQGEAQRGLADELWFFASALTKEEALGAPGGAVGRRQALEDAASDTRAWFDALGSLALFERRKVPLPWALAAIGGEPGHARALLSELDDLHLLDRLEPDSLALSGDAQRLSRPLFSETALLRLADFAARRLFDPRADTNGELPLFEALIDLLSVPFEGPLEDALTARPGVLSAELAARASGLLAICIPLVSALASSPTKATGRRLTSALRAARALAQGQPDVVVRDLLGALGQWLATLAGQHHEARVVLQQAIETSLALGDARAAARLLAMRAPLGYYLGDIEQGLADISEAVRVAELAGDHDGAHASKVMYALGLAHMRGAWSEAMALLEAATGPAVIARHTGLIAALARVDLAVCELVQGRAPSSLDALGAAFEVLFAATAEMPFDEAGLRILALALGVSTARTPRWPLGAPLRAALEASSQEPGPIAVALFSALSPELRQSTLLRADILADAFLALDGVADSAPDYAARDATVALPLIPGSALQTAIGHHLPILLPLQAFAFLREPLVIDAALALVSDQLGDEHPLHHKISRLAAQR